MWFRYVQSNPFKVKQRFNIWIEQSIIPCNYDNWRWRIIIEIFYLKKKLSVFKQLEFYLCVHRWTNKKTNIKITFNATGYYFHRYCVIIECFSYYVSGAAVKMELQPALDPRKQELLEARCIGVRVCRFSCF